MQQAIEREQIAIKKKYSYRFTPGYELVHELLILLQCFLVSSQLKDKEQYLPIKPMDDFLMTSTGFHLHMKYWDMCNLCSSQALAVV